MTDNNDTMLAFCITRPGDKQGQVMRVPKPTLPSSSSAAAADNWALIRVLRAGVCNTDLEILQGYMGFHGVLGHEFVGVVEQVSNKDASNNNNKWIGKRVCGDINVGCADCAVCLDMKGLNASCSQMSRNHCPHRTVLGILNRNGTMAEYLTLPIRNLHVVPDEIPDQVAVFAEPLAAACRISEQELIYYGNSNNTKRPPDRVAILGDGKLGLMIAEVLGRQQKHFGHNNDNARPVLFGKHPHKLQLVQDSGVEGRLVQECQDASAFNGVAAQHAHRYDVVVDATGSPAGLALAAGLCRPMGTLVLKSTCAAGEQFNAAPFVIDELHVVGSRCGPIDKALDLLQLPESDSSIPPLNVEKYITKTFPLSQADQAIQCAAEKLTMKVQIICSESSSHSE